MSKQRNIRKRRAVDEEDDGPGGDDGRPALSADEIKALQKQRQKRTGVDATALALAGAKNDAVPTTDAAEAPNGGALHAAFSRERAQLTADDDPEMKRYVEEQLARRLGKELPDDPSSQGPKRHKTVEELALEAAVPKQKEGYDEPGAAFVAGVTEVPLGVEHRLKNIEATEAAKAALLAKGRGVGGGGFDDDDDGGYGGSGGGGGGFSRAQFPVRFGRMSEREQNVVSEVAAKKAAARARAMEKKQEKEGSFKGFF